MCVCGRMKAVVCGCILLVREWLSEADGGVAEIKVDAGVYVAD